MSAVFSRGISIPKAICPSEWAGPKYGVLGWLEAVSQPKFFRTIQCELHAKAGNGTNPQILEGFLRAVPVIVKKFPTHG